MRMKDPFQWVQQFHGFQSSEGNAFNYTVAGLVIGDVVGYIGATRYDNLWRIYGSVTWT